MIRRYLPWPLYTRFPGTTFHIRKHSIFDVFMDAHSFTEKATLVMKKILRWTIALVVIGFTALFSFYYFATYEEGVMAGRVLSITQRGMIFKTYEGKLSVESFGSLKGVSPIAETRDFSVEKGEVSVIKDLETAAANGDRVNLRFIRRYKAFPWRGETNYFVIGVEKSSF